jgi:hypothetical protein
VVIFHDTTARIGLYPDVKSPRIIQEIQKLTLLYIYFFERFDRKEVSFIFFKAGRDIAP